MRNFLATIGLLVVLFVGLGWYFKWYDFDLSRTADGKRQIKLDVDTDKIATDAKDFGNRVGNAVQNSGTPTTAPDPAGTPAGLMGPPLPPNYKKPEPAPSPKVTVGKNGASLTTPGGFEIRVPPPGR